MDNAVSLRNYVYLIFGNEMCFYTIFFLLYDKTFCKRKFYLQKRKPQTNTVNMEVLERFEMPKWGAEALSEDRIVFTNSFAAVVDGCSNRLGLEYEGFSSGFIASKCIELAISRFSFDVDMFDALRIMDDTIREWYLEHGLFDTVRHNPRMRISCYFAIFSEYRREVWVLGACPGFNSYDDRSYLRIKI